MFLKVSFGICNSSVTVEKKVVNMSLSELWTLSPFGFKIAAFLLFDNGKGFAYGEHICFVKSRISVNVMSRFCTFFIKSAFDLWLILSQNFLMQFN